MEIEKFKKAVFLSYSLEHGQEWEFILFILFSKLTGQQQGLLQGFNQAVLFPASTCGINVIPSWKRMTQFPQIFVSPRKFIEF